MAKERTGLISGLNKGHKTTPNETKQRISRTKGHLSRRTAFVREVVKEVAGLAPYERRVVELLRNAQDKRARKVAKKRHDQLRADGYLGTNPGLSLVISAHMGVGALRMPHVTSDAFGRWPRFAMRCHLIKFSLVQSTCFLKCQQLFERQTRFTPGKAAELIAMVTSAALGTFGRAKRKVDEMQKVIAESRRAGQH
ncbi:hypothetical protein KEM54_000476 [Ascosphaera aggregata]|nr:hypothetical protein KEM54_000476 [Ascosphaera aggregata]